MQYSLIRKTQEINFIIILILSAFLLTGCFEKGGPIPLSEMTPQQKSIVMFDMYNSQYSTYMMQTGYINDGLGTWQKTSQPVYSDDELKTLRIKRGVLTEVHPLIKIFDNYTRNGVLTTPEMEAQIFRLLDKLVKGTPD